VKPGCRQTWNKSLPKKYLTVLKNTTPMKKLLSLLLFFSALSEILAQAIPMDSRIKKGQLENGLTYYIMQNKKPEKKVELRLVVNAGSILEDEDQQGLAHFLEHMLFNGTKNFKKNELVDYLQSIGVKFGADLNAYTSFDETVYILPIPTEKPEIVEKGFQVLEDWAHNALLDAEEIDKERGVVLEEYRLGLGADKRMWERYLPVILKNSRYAERLPIGKKEILETFKPETLRKFYKDWYRPDLMSVIVVGDIDPAAAEAMIQKHFAHIIGPENPRNRMEFVHPFINETRFAVESDPESAYNSFNLTYFQPGIYQPAYNEAQYRDEVLTQLNAMVFQERCADIAQKPNPPFSFAGNFTGPYFSRKNNSLGFYAYFDDNKSQEAFKTTYREILRLQNFGITEAELQRAKKDMIAYAEKMFNDRNKTESGNMVYDCLNNFLEGTSAPSPDWYLEFLKKHLPALTAEQVNTYIQQRFQTENIAVVFEMNQKAENKKPTVEELKQWMAEISAETISKAEEVVVNASLLKTAPTPVRGYSIAKTSAPGVKSLTLKNGAKILYKPTDFKDDEISFQAYSPGGTSTVSTGDLGTTAIALSWLSSPTLNGMNPATLSKVNSGKYAWVSAGLGGYREYMRGTSGKADLEVMMQWIHLYFTALEYNKDDYSAFKDKQVGFYTNLLSDPGIYFQVEMQKILAYNNPRFTGFPTAASWEQQDPEKVFAIMKSKFSNARDFTFLFAGNIDESKFIDLCETYIATLPASPEKEKVVPRLWPNPPAPIDTTILRGTEPKSNVNIIISSEAKYNPKIAMHLDLLAEVLEIKLTEILREESSGVYGIGTYSVFSRKPDEQYTFYISFPCGPENAEKLSKMAMDELNKILANGPDPKDLAKVKEAKRLALDENLKDNSFWVDKLLSAIEHGDKLSDPAKEYKEIEKVKEKDLQKTANKYLKRPGYRFVLKPEK
jgi:zinc protease